MQDQKQLSFEKDIKPIFAGYKDEMIWRFDLTSYDEVKANSEAICKRITLKGMPPPPLEPLTDTQILDFQLWIEQGCLR